MSDKQDWMTVKQIADHFNMSISQVNYMRGFPEVLRLLKKSGLIRGDHEKNRRN